MKQASLPREYRYGLKAGRKFYLNIFARLPVDMYIPDPDDCNIHRGIPALPFSQSENTVSRQKPESYPKILQTIGDHIRAWRIDNHLLQRDIAKVLSVCEATIVGWEMRRTIPTMQQMPEIIKMLGYLPIKISVSTLGGKIIHYRYIHGLTPKEFGLFVSANPSTVRAWEANKHLPTKRKQERIEKLLE